MTAFNDCLYAGTGNPSRGFQIWKTEAKGSVPYTLEPVLVVGAYRNNLNEVAISMVAYKDALYIGTGIPGL